jgi:excisionase family DNA binding protein
METYLTVEEVAAAVKLSLQTIRRYVLKKEIPYHKINRVVRFKPSEIERWIEKWDKKTSADVRGRIEGDLFAGVCCPPAADSLGVFSANSGENKGSGADGESGELPETGEGRCPPQANGLGVCRANSGREKI